MTIMPITRPDDLRSTDIRPRDVFAGRLGGFIEWPKRLFKNHADLVGQLQTVMDSRKCD